MPTVPIPLPLRSLPHPDEMATERAAELCSQCQLSPKQLFVLPTSGDMQVYGRDTVA